MTGPHHEAVQQTLLGDASEHADVGMMVWNAERRYVAANTKACELIGTPRDKLLAGHVGDSNRSPAVGSVIEEILRKVPARGSTTIERGDGSAVDVEWVVFPTRLAGLPHIVGLMWPAAEF